MKAPDAPADPIQNEVAWNSFAHTEFFDDNGRTVQLPATEPIKTGVALVYGDFTVTKAVTGSAADGPFSFAYRCRVTPEAPGGETAEPVEVSTGSFQLAAGEPLTITARPARGSCLVWETDTAGLISDADGEANAKRVTVPVGGSADVPTVAITNRAAPPTPTPTPSPTPSVSPSVAPTSTSPSSPSTGTGTTTEPPATGDDGDSSPGGSGDLPDTGMSALMALALLGAVALLVTGGAVLAASRLHSRARAGRHG